MTGLVEWLLAKKELEPSTAQGRWSSETFLQLQQVATLTTTVVANSW